MISRI